jgi:hypothetical protein
VTIIIKLTYSALYISPPDGIQAWIVWILDYWTWLRHHGATIFGSWRKFSQDEQPNPHRKQKTLSNGCCTLDRDRGTRTKAKMGEMRRQLLGDKSVYSRLVEVLSVLDWFTNLLCYCRGKCLWVKFPTASAYVSQAWYSLYWRLRSLDFCWASLQSTNLHREIRVTALLCCQTVLLLLTVEPNKISAPVYYAKISDSEKASITNLNSGQPCVQDYV